MGTIGTGAKVRGGSAPTAQVGRRPGTGGGVLVRRLDERETSLGPNHNQRLAVQRL